MLFTWVNGSVLHGLGQAFHQRQLGWSQPVFRGHPWPDPEHRRTVLWAEGLPAHRRAVREHQGVLLASEKLSCILR